MGAQEVISVGLELIAVPGFQRLFVQAFTFLFVFFRQASVVGRLPLVVLEVSGPLLVFVASSAFLFIPLGRRRVSVGLR